MSAGLIGGIAIAGAGVIFCLISIPFLLREQALIRNCIGTTTGKVVKYRRGSGGGTGWVSPLVEFEVDGKKYHAYRHYKGVVRPVVSKPMIDPATGKYLPFYIDEKERFHMLIYRLDVMPYPESYERKTVGEIWPIGSEMVVVYNPNKPKQAFVEKVVSLSKIAGICLLCCGLGYIALGVVAGYLLR